MITNATGASVNDMQAELFGRRFATASGSAPRTAMAFPGQIIDIADRHYNMYRDYDPTLGRYLQADPIGLGGGDNVYGYVGGNPVGYTDPEGLNPVLRGIAAGAGKLRTIWKDLNFDGPSPGLAHGNGRVCQIRYKKQPVLRMDYQPIEKSKGQSRLHLHFGKDMNKHRSIDPRSLRDE